MRFRCPIILPRILCRWIAVAIFGLACLPPADGIESRDHVWDITFPLEKNRATYAQGWHDCRPSASTCTRAHRAVDLYAPPGTPVYAAADGIIRWRRTSTASDWSPTSGSGYALYIDAPNGDFRHFYGHFGPDQPQREEEAFAVNPATGELWKVGDSVTRGQRLGWVGTSGATASGPHLHFELRSLKRDLPTDDPGPDAISGRSYGDPDATIGSFSYLRYDPFYSLQAAESRGDYPAGDPELGDYVRVVGVASALNMRGPEACDPVLSGKGRPLGMVGRVIAGPAACPAITSHNMWRIQWSDCEIGWSSQLYLEVVPTGEIPCPESQVSIEISGEGTVALSPDLPSYPAGSTVEIQAEPAAEYEFVHWSGSVAGAVNPLLLTVDHDLSLTAHFLRTYEAWEQAYFSAAERETEGWTDPAADPFGTGVANLAIYAFGLNVRAPDRTLLPRIEREGDGFSFVFAQVTDVADLAYVVEVSPDLSAWSVLPPEEGTWEVVESLDPSKVLVRVALHPDPAGATHFVRLRIVRNA